MKRWLVLGGVGLAVAAAGLLAYAHWPPSPLPEDAKADRVVVLKGERRLLLLDDSRVLRGYRVALGRDPLGAKRREGDNRTPEGKYRIDYRNPDSRYHLSLHISYPSPGDRERARRAGVDPGGMIVIHGIRNGWGWIGRLHRLADWTRGCIAVTDPEIREIWRSVANGTPIEIRP
jgi:murein L,D-transpeptidase YafK